MLIGKFLVSNTKLIITICAINLILLMFQLVPDIIVERYLERYASDALRISNTYNWETYTGKEGISYYSPELQKGLFLKDLKENMQYVKCQKITSRCYVEQFKGVKIIDKINAQVYLTARYIKSDLNMKRSYSTDMVLIMRKNQEKWVIYNIIFKKDETGT
ncbi:hypothetical protein ABDB91_11570 [Desulfoscipio sp. XC116]|uniref:hypothetical protein n=1 Tax=Desulfoscipio sp. XC116 TaxID=3144975 RepID=UPI00325B8C9D